MVKLGYVGIDCFQDLADLVMFSHRIIHVHGNQLYGGISCTFPHAVYAAVYYHGAFDMSGEHGDAVCVAHLEVVVRMVSEADAGIQIGIQQFKIMQQVVLVHQPVSINHGDSIRLYFICQPDQIKHFIIAVACDGYKLCKHLVSQLL